MTSPDPTTPKNQPDADFVVCKISQTPPQKKQKKNIEAVSVSVFRTLAVSAMAWT
jgi:hypothetical protein